MVRQIEDSEGGELAKRNAETRFPGDMNRSAVRRETARGDLRSVDLPAPLHPNITRNSPGMARSVADVSTRRPSKLLATQSAVRIAFTTAHPRRA